MLVVEGVGGMIINWSGESFKWLLEIGIIFCFNGIWMGSLVLGNCIDNLLFRGDKLIIFKNWICDCRYVRI